MTVSDVSTAQAWEGFGGAFNELGWHYLSMLSETDRDAALHLLYGADGARFAFGRIPIGATDYAIDRYTLDETPDGAPDDTSLPGFSIDRDTQALIPFVKAAQAVKANIRFGPAVDADVDEGGAVFVRQLVSPFDGGTMRRRRDDDGVRAVPDQVRAGVAQQGINRGDLPQNEPNTRTCRPAAGRRRPTRSSSASISARRSGRGPNEDRPAPSTAAGRTVRSSAA